MKWGNDSEQEIDYIIKQVKQSPSSEGKVKLLNRLSDLLIKNKQINASLDYARQASQLSKSIDYKEGLAIAYTQMGNAFFNTDKEDEALVYYCKALEYIDQQPENTHYLLQQIARIHHLKNNFKKAISFSQQALAESKSLPLNQQLLSTLLLQSNSYLQVSNCDKAMETARKSLALSISLNATKQTSEALLLLGRINLYKGNFQKALDFVQEGLREAEKLVDQVLITQHYNLLSEIYIDQSKYEKALENAIVALKIAKELEDHALIRHSRSNMGIAQLYKEQLPMALLNLSEALAISEKLNNKNSKAIDLTNLGTLYGIQGETFKALDYFLTAWQLIGEESNSNKSTLFYILLRMGIVFSKQQQYELAYKKLTQALAISQETGNPLFKGKVMHNLGLLHYRQKSYDFAYNYYNQSYQLFQSIDHQRGIGSTLNLIAACSNALQQKDQAFKYAQQALSINEKVDNKTEIAQSCFLLYQLYKEKNAFKQALLYHEKYNEYKEILSNNHRNKEIKKLEMQLKIQQKEVSIAQLQMQNLQLSEYNIKEIKKFASIASHDLRTPLNHIQSFANIVKERSQELLDEDSLQFLNIIEESSRHMAQLIKELQNYANAGLHEKKLELVDLNAVIDDIQLILHEAISKSNTSILIDPLPKIHCYKKDIQTIFTELITNAIKFRKQDQAPSINISVQKEDSFYIFSIKDNGIGIDKSYEDKVFELFRKLHTNNDYPGFGTGLPICRKILLGYNGQIWLAPDSNNGACFKFSFPIPLESSENEIIS